jgi:Kinesin motor domain
MNGADLPLEEEEEVQRSTVIQFSGARERDDGISGESEDPGNLPNAHPPNQYQARRNGGSGPLSVAAISAPEVGGELNRREGSTSNDADNDNNDDGYTSVQVAVRVRPTLEDEDDDCIRCLMPPPQHLNHPSGVAAPTPPPPLPPQTLQVGGSKGPVFTFDRVFGKASHQAELYHGVVAPLVTNCLEGYNATVLACTFSFRSVPPVSAAGLAC